MRLLHPMMPFLTEELYHKLPPYAGKSETITLAPYPEVVSEWENADIDTEFKYID